MCLNPNLSLFNCLIDSKRRDIPDLKSCANNGEETFQVHFKVMVGLETGLVNQELAALPQGSVCIIEDLLFQLAIEQKEGNT